MAFFGAHPQQRHRPFINGHGPPPPAPHRQCARAFARGLIVVPGPVRRCTFSLVELQGTARLHAPPTVAITVKQAHIERFPTTQVLRCRIDDSLAICGCRELSRQIKQLRGFLLCVSQCLQLPTLASRKVTGQGRHEQEKHQRQHVFFALNAQREVGRDEQKVVGQK